MLFVFVIAAAAMIILYMELPRAVFESARQKEDILVERGEQYKLAIKRYYVKNKKLPQNLDELDKTTGGVRFLRRRYKDPMTGEDDWRLIHVDAGGNYLDSKVHKPVRPGEEQKEIRQSSVGQFGALVPVASEGDDRGGQAIALRQRATDRMPLPGQGAGTGAAGGSDSAADAPPPPPGSPGVAPISLGGPIGLPAGMQDPDRPVGPGPSGPGFGALGGPGQSNFNPGAPQGMPGQPGMPMNTPGTVSNSQFGGISPVPLPANQIGAPPAQGVFPGQPGYPQLGLPGQQGTAQGQNQALDMIRNLLTTPRQGPAPGFAPQQQVGMQGGLVGVASKYKGEGIKRIADRARIDEWEFLFDLRSAMQQGQNQGQGIGMGGVPGGGRPGQGTGQGQGQGGGFGMGSGLGSGGQRPGQGNRPGGPGQGNGGGFGSGSPFPQGGSGRGRQ